MENVNLYGDVINICKYFSFLNSNIFNFKVQKFKTVENIFGKKFNIFLHRNSQIIKSRQRLLRFLRGKVTDLV